MLSVLLIVTFASLLFTQLAEAKKGDWLKINAPFICRTMNDSLISLDVADDGEYVQPNKIRVSYSGVGYNLAPGNFKESLYETLDVTDGKFTFRLFAITGGFQNACASPTIFDLTGTCNSSEWQINGETQRHPQMPTYIQC